MTKAEGRLAELGIEVPDVQAPLGAYVPAVVSGNLIFISGQLPLVKGELEFKGKVGSDVSVEHGMEAARRASINAIAVLKSELGNDGNSVLPRPRSIDFTAICARDTACNSQRTPSSCAPT